MERFRIKLPKEDNIIIRDKFIVDKIYPLCIRNIDRNHYTILFIARQNCTEEDVYIQMLFNSSNNIDEKFFNNYLLNINNIQNDENALNFFLEKTKDIQSNHIYVCDFDMKEFSEKKLYYITTGALLLDTQNNSALLDFLITRDNYIKLNLFFNRLSNNNSMAHNVFSNKKLNNIEYVRIDHIKLDASATDISSNIICNHYTCGRGPTTFKFNYISKKIPDLKLRNPLLPELYNTFYGKSFSVSDMIYDTEKDNLIVLIEERSEISDIYKSTKALIMRKEIYNKTNLIDPYYIYTKENKNESDIIF